MRFPDPVVEATFVRRPNRFVTICEIDGEEERPAGAGASAGAPRGAARREVRCFIPNPGRLNEFLTPGRPVLLHRVPDHVERATRFTHLAFRYNGRWISVDTHLPNKLVAEGIREGAFPFLRGYTEAIPEQTYGRSRFDFLLKGPGLPDCYLEVKSVTLVVPDKALHPDNPKGYEAAWEGFDEGVGLFPDAVSERAAKHVSELAEAADEGHRAIALFLVQRDDARVVRPHAAVDPGFAAALREAEARGVELRAWACRSAREGVSLLGALPVETA